MSERYANKRMMFRSGGRFSKPPTLADLGFDVNNDGAVTCVCGFTFTPVLRTGKCPKCGSQERRSNG
jgi:hypothetical protein